VHQIWIKNTNKQTQKNKNQKKDPLARQPFQSQHTEKNGLKNRSTLQIPHTASGPVSFDRAKNQPICQVVARFFTICFGHDIDENAKGKASLFFGTTILSPSPSLLWTPRGSWQMRKNRP
jgi:hypothetical protein